MKRSYIDVILLFGTGCDILNLQCHFYGGMWRSLVAHFVRDEGAAGSNPVIPIVVVHSQIICRNSQVNVVVCTLMSIFMFFIGNLSMLSFRELMSLF